MRSILFDFGYIQVPAYGFMIMLGFMGAMLLAYYRAKLSGVRPEIVIDLGIYGMITGIIGARLWYIIQYHHFFDWRMFDFSDGGFSLLGGLAGLFVFLASYRNLDAFFYCGITFLIRGMLEYQGYLSRPLGKLHLLDMAVLLVLAFIAYSNRERYKNYFSTRRKAFFLTLLLFVCMAFTARLSYMGIHYFRYDADQWPRVSTSDRKDLQICVIPDDLWKAYCEAFQPSLLEDKRFTTSKLRLKQISELTTELRPVFQKEKAEVWLEKLKEKNILAKPLLTSGGKMIPGDSFGLFKIWKGGMVSFGGLFFATFVLCFIVAKYKLPLARVVDFCAPGIPFAIAITRAGCFMNGCCYGGIPESAFHIGVTYPHKSLCWAHHFEDLKIIPFESAAKLVHAAQFYESIACIFIFFLLTWWYPRRRKEGDMIFLLGMCYGIARFLVEQVRDDTPIVALGRNIGELTGIGLFLLSLFSFLNLRYHWIPIMKYLSFLDPLKGAEVDYAPEKR